jgi:spermidine synthase
MLMVGLGGAALSNCLTRWFPDLKIDIVEVDGKVIDVSKKYFSLRESSRCRVFEEDGRVFIQKRKGQEPYDWIILDAFKSGSIPYHLKTCGFYKEIREVLSPNGVVGSNLYGKGNTLKSRDIQTFLSVFPQIYCFEDDDQIATVLIATDGKRWSEEKIRNRASICRKLPEPFSMEEIVKAYRPGKFQEESVSTFKDNFSGNGFLNDVERENLQSSKDRRYPIINVY